MSVEAVKGELSQAEELALRLKAARQRLSNELWDLRSLVSARQLAPYEAQLLADAADALAQTAACMRDALGGDNDPFDPRAVARGKRGSYLRAVRKALGFTNP